jgi:SAM-dependent methyltransferase
MQAHLRSIAHQRAEIIERAVPNGRRILDVGSGSGHFLDVMRERGWTVQGVEPVDESAAIAREQFGLDVRTSTLEDSGLPEASYDVVSLFHVVEHMQDTTAFVRSVSKWIRPGGSLVIEVPNFAGLARRRHSEQWIHLRPLEHVAHFTPGTLDYLFRHTDMEQWRIRTPTWIGYPLTVSQVIDLFGLPPAVARATRPISRIDVFDGESAMRPTEVGWKVWSVVESMYRLTHLGGLTLGIARTRTR